jgi:hypothetical protein
MPQLRTALDATGYAARADACHVILPSGEDIQIIVLGPYTEDLDAVRFMRPSTVDGLQGREFANSDQGSGECAVSVNVRAVSDLDINSWNTDPAANNNATHRATSCRHAEQTADIIVRRFVPLVHGTPFPGALQQPTATALAGMSACDAATTDAAFYADYLDDRKPIAGSTPLGSTCRYTGKPGTISVILTSAAVPLARFPTQLPHSVVTDGALGVLAARSEHTPDACTEAIQLPTGQVLALTYRTTIPELRPSVCPATTSSAANAIGELLDRGTEPFVPTAAPDTSPSPTTSIDPCALLTGSDVQQLGLQLNGRDTAGGGRGCSWHRTGQYTVGFGAFDHSGLGELSTNGRTITDHPVGSHDGRLVLSAGDSCGVFLQITKTSMVDVAVAGALDDAQTCQLADQYAKLIEPRLPAEQK